MMMTPNNGLPNPGIKSVAQTIDSNFSAEIIPREAALTVNLTQRFPSKFPNFIAIAHFNELLHSARRHFTT